MLLLQRAVAQTRRSATIQNDTEPTQRPYHNQRKSERERDELGLNSSKILGPRKMMDPDVRDGLMMSK